MSIFKVYESKSYPWNGMKNDGVFNYRKYGIYSDFQNWSGNDNRAKKNFGGKNVERKSRKYI